MEHPPEGSSVSHLAERDASEWGLGALTISAVLATMAPIVLVLAVEVWSSSCHESGPVRLHAWLARVGVGVALTLAALAGCFGAKAVHCAVKRGQPLGLAVAGLSLSVGAIVFWIITAIALLNTTESLLRLYG